MGDQLGGQRYYKYTTLSHTAPEEGRGGGGGGEHPYWTILGGLTFNREYGGGLGLASIVGGPAGEGAGVLRVGLLDV